MHLIVSPQMEGLGNWVVGRPNSYKWVVSGPRIPPDLRYALPSPRHHGAYGWRFPGIYWEKRGIGWGLGWGWGTDNGHIMQCHLSLTWLI